MGNEGQGSFNCSALSKSSSDGAPVGDGSGSGVGIDSGEVVSVCMGTSGTRSGNGAAVAKAPGFVKQAANGSSERGG